MAEPVVNLKDQALVRIGKRIDAAWKRLHESDSEWIEASLELMQALKEGRDKFGGNDRAFGAWLKDNGHDHVSKNDRSALLKMANDIAGTRDLLSKTKSRSYRHIYPQVGKDRQQGKIAKPRPKSPKVEELIGNVYKLAATGMVPKDIAKEVGIGHRYVNQMLEHKQIGDTKYTEGQEDAAGLAAAAALSMSAKEKLEAALRVHRKLLEKEYDTRRMQENKEHWDRLFPTLTQEKNDAYETKKNYERFLEQQKKIFNVDQFKTILMVLHPDGDRSPEKRTEAFRLFNAKKFALTGEK